MHDRVLSPRLLLLIAMALPIAGCTNPLAVSISVSPTTQSISRRPNCAVHGHRSLRPWEQPSLRTAGPHGFGDLDFERARRGHDQRHRRRNRRFRRHNDHHRQHQRIYGRCFRIGHAHSIGQLGRRWRDSVIDRNYPNTQLVTTVGDTAQFQAIETTSTGATVDVTNLATWGSSSPSDRHHRRQHRACHRSESGHSHDHRDLSSGGSTLTGTATFTVGSGSPGTGGSTEEYTAVTIVPGSQSVSASGQTGQFIALATLGANGLEEDVTNSPQIDLAFEHSIGRHDHHGARLRQRPGHRRKPRHQHHHCGAEES